MTDPVLACRNVTFVRPYGKVERRVLNGIDAAFQSGEIALVSGETGAGKTTMLCLLAGMLRPTSGEVLAEGEAISRWTAFHLDRWRRNTGFVFQTPLLWPDLTVLENIIVPLIPRGMDARSIEKSGREMLDTVGLPEMAGRCTAELSGGEQQRLSLARALVGRPRYLFADEPTSQQDDNGVEIVGHLMAQARRQGTMVIIASHDTRLSRIDVIDRRWRIENSVLEEKR